MQKNRGFIREILIIVVILIVLGYFGLNIDTIIHSNGVQSNLSWLWNIILVIWSWISIPIMWVWNTLIIGILWHGIQAGLGQ